MKQIALVLLLAAGTVAASAQTPAKPATSSTTATKSATPAHTAAAASGVKLPPGVPPGHGILKTAFALKYQDLKLGTGAVAEPGKLYKLHYTGWLASTGSKFDSSYDHPAPPLKDKDGKPVLGADGKPVPGEPQPFVFPQGAGRVMPGFDQGFEGMKIGGKRRLFIPWQLAYGTRGRPGPDAAHPGIPPKSDLIFDVELIEQNDMPAPPQRPGMPPGARTPPVGITPHPPAVGQPGARPAPGTAPAPGAPAAPGTPPAPATPGTTPPAPGTAPASPAPAPPATTPAPATPAPNTPPVTQPTAPVTPPPSK